MNMEHIRGEITSILSEETYIQAPIKIGELFEDKTLELRQEKELYRKTLEYVHSFLEMDSHQGMSFDKKRVKEILEDVLNIKKKEKKIPQIVERDGVFSIEQKEFPLGLQPEDYDVKADMVQEEYNIEKQEYEASVCTQCGYIPNGLHEESCDKYVDDNYGCMDEIATGMRVQ